MMDLFTELDQRKITEDLFAAYYDARKHKRNTINALAFERNFEANVFELCDDILSRNYEPRPSICFIVNKPVKREIFAADFRDRVVHHFIYNYISPIFERKFINDSYSCRKGKGIHYGVKRADHFIRSCSLNYTRDCYILKIDIAGYFMSIDRKLLYGKIKNTLLSGHKAYDFDLGLILFLIEKTIFQDPTVNCRRKGKPEEWIGLPRNKSLFFNKQKGLPIGNLTSQLFGNVYLNDFDQYVKRELKIKYYARYVDDILIVHENKSFLQEVLAKMQDYLHQHDKLKLHPRKIYLQHYTKGVGFIGAYIKPRRIYILNRTKGNFYEAIYHLNKTIGEKGLDQEEVKKQISILNSYLGLTRHYHTYNIRKKLVFDVLSPLWWKYAWLDGKIERFVLKKGEKK